MKVSGTSELVAGRDAVWRALNDPAVLVRTIPGCRRLEAVGEDTYKMTVSAGVGAIKGVYDGEVRLTDQQLPGSFRMRAQGAGAPGTIGADVLVTLDERPDGGTLLTYDADATVGGMIGGVGQRMLTGVSKRMADEFFGNVEAVLAGAVPTGPSGGADGRTGEGAPTVEGTGRPATKEPDWMGGVPSPGSPAAASPGPRPGQVFTAPAPAQTVMQGDFVKGVLVGAGLVLAGVLAGGLLGRRPPRSRG